MLILDVINYVKQQSITFRHKMLIILVIYMLDVINDNNKHPE